MRRLRSCRARVLALGTLTLLVAAACTPSASTAQPLQGNGGGGATTVGSVTASVDPADVMFVIPAGTEAATERDEAAFQFPAPIRLQAGHAVAITNQDDAMHYFFDIPIAPGETIRKVFPRAGIFVYQGGESCSTGHSSAIWVRVDPS
jgi:hypothetical protein